MSKTPRTDAVADWDECDRETVPAHIARELEIELTEWRAIAHLLAQRLRLKVESADDRWLVVRDREVLAEYDNLIKTL